MTVRKRLAGLALAGCLAACGHSASRSQPPNASSPASLSAAELAGRRFAIIGITDAGASEPIVSNTNPSVTFTPQQLHVDTGCNAISAEYAIVDGRFTVKNAASTAMGCPENRATQEARINRAFDGASALTRAGDTYTLSGGDVILTLASA
jgi:heat shock protein HslJ